MDTSILLTKLYAPSLSSRAVRRPRLIEKLNEGLDTGNILTLVSAPAGYGKSTLIAEWIPAFEGHAVWLSLDDRDNNPLRFWTYFAAAIRTAEKPLGDALMELLRSEPHFDLHRFLTALVNLAAGLQQRLILVLDDYHQITLQDIHEGLVFLLEHLPPTLHLVVTTRTDPPLPLSRLRVRGRLTELRLADLRFTLDETGLLFNGLMNIGLEADDVQAIETRTEGWIAGLQLAALSMRGREDTHAFVRDFTGSQHFVLEYLVDEVLQSQPEPLQRFLLETSILRRMCAPLCDAITAVSGSAETLTELRRSNLFIVPLDDRHCWFRYHHLFAEFLKGHLERLHADELPLLHRRAAQWFQSNNYPEEALQHAFAIPDYAYVSRLVVDHWRNVYHKGRLDTAVRWLESLPDGLLRESPPLGVAWCWTLFIRGDYGRIETHLDSIGESFRALAASGSLPDGHPEYTIILQQVLLLRAAVLRHRGETAAAIEELERLLPTIPGFREILGEPYVHMGLTACYSQLGYACAAAGELEKAEEWLGRVSPHARECGNIFSLAHVTFERACINLSLGRRKQAEEFCRYELSLMEEEAFADYPAFCLIQLALADVLLAGNEPDEAERLLGTGLETAAKSGHEYYLARGYLIAARLRHARGNQDGTQEDVRRAQRIAASLGNRFLDEELAATLQALNSRTAPVQPLVEPLSERELEVLRLICEGKSNREIADELFLALDTVKRHANNLYGKLGVNRRTQAVAEARRLGLI